MNKSHVEKQVSSPHVTHISWGEVIVAGWETPFRDVKLFPGGAREWDWNETGTRHVPGIQPADVQELLDHGASVIVLSKGFQERLELCPGTLQLLAEHRVQTHILQSEEAVKVYNDLRQSEAVGALIHSTC